MPEIKPKSSGGKNAKTAKSGDKNAKQDKQESDDATKVVSLDTFRKKK